MIRANQPQVVLVRWGHEMDLSGLYPWAANDPDLYKLAFRHVEEIFTAAGATNVRWVWSPAGKGNALDYYPGDDVVDYLGLTILGDAGWDSELGSSPQPFEYVLRPRYNRLAGIGKPMIVAEAAVTGDPQRQNTWLEGMVDSFDAYPLLRGVVHFDAPQSADQSVRHQARLARVAIYVQNTCDQGRIDNQKQSPGGVVGIGLRQQAGNRRASCQVDVIECGCPCPECLGAGV